MVLYNASNDTILEGDLLPVANSIASISKLMTVYTVLQESQNLNENLTVTAKRLPNSHISKGMTLTRRDLITLALVSSDNLAAITLGENYPGGMERFVKKMNENAERLGMVNSGFVEPSGLDPMNYSSAPDIIALTQAVSKFPIVIEAAHTKQVSVKSKRGKRMLKVRCNPTSPFFGSKGIIAIKTGFTNAAGFCITMLVSAHNQLFSIVVLGAKTKNERKKFVEKSLKTIYRI